MEIVQFCLGESYVFCLHALIIKYVRRGIFHHIKNSFRQPWQIYRRSNEGIQCFSVFHSTWSGVILHKNSPTSDVLIDQICTQKYKAQHKHRVNVITLDSEFMPMVKAILLMNGELVIVMIVRLCVLICPTVIRQRVFVRASFQTNRCSD